ncbi:hypothetical protein ACFX1Q_023621 [Malus domestica]
MGIDSGTPPNSHIACQHKKRRVSRDTCFSLSGTFSHLEAYVPYHGFCSRVLDFIVGRLGYGSVKYPGKTDIRCLELDNIVKFHRYEPIEVTLVLQTRPSNIDKRQKYNIVKKLRFGLNEDDEEDIMMEDSASAQDLVEMNHGEISDGDEESQMDLIGIVLSHSLLVHLRLDPVKMEEMRMLMFHDEEEEVEDLNHIPVQYNSSFASSRMSQRSTPPAVRKTPLALLEYKHGSFDSNSLGTILMAQENKAMPPKTLKEGFKLDLDA